ncbi:MAG: hypothetical protein FGM37_00200 [Phycisphaerales bacterium]|nr:hypothetical protein [Phycisphaerales bacterium]
MSGLVAVLSVALGALTSLAVPGAGVALDADPVPEPRDLASDGHALFVVGRAHMPGLAWVSVCRESTLVHQATIEAADTARAAHHMAWPDGDEVLGMLSVGWPWPFIDMTWMRGAREDFPADPRDNLSESGSLTDAVRRAVSANPPPKVTLVWGSLAASAGSLAVPWWLALTLAARARRSAPARTARSSARS